MFNSPSDDRESTRPADYNIQIAFIHLQLFETINVHRHRCWHIAYAPASVIKSPITLVESTPNYIRVVPFSGKLRFGHDRCILPKLDLQSLFADGRPQPGRLTSISVAWLPIRFLYPFDLICFFL